MNQRPRIDAYEDIVIAPSKMLHQRQSVSAMSDFEISRRTDDDSSTQNAVDVLDSKSHIIKIDHRRQLVKI